MFDRRWTLNLLACLGLTIPTLTAVAAEDPVKRVRVDLDFERLGMLDEGGQRIELEIHCQGARPMHQVAMDGDVLVVQVQALPDARDAVLELAGVDGIEVSIDRSPMPVAEVASPARPVDSFDDLPPLVVDPVLEEVVLEVAPPVAAEPLPGDGLVVTDTAAKVEVMAAMEAAMAEAREENAARLMEASLADETDPDRSSSWVTVQDGDVVAVR
jgi:hypothetical protein